MNRGQFDGIFSELVRRLGAKVTKYQAELYFDEYGKGDLRDFAHACREMAMGSAGYMPKSEIMRDYVAAAKEMRMHQEAAHRDKLAKNVFAQAGAGSIGPMDALFAKCCAKRIHAEPKEAVAFIEGALALGQFVEWLQSWRTADGQIALTWLQEHMERKRASQGAPMAMIL